MRQLERDDPWITVIAWPCGPWGSWARFQLGRGGIGAENITRQREESRGLLEFSARVAQHRLERGRLVLMENPWVSDAWQHEALEEVLLDPAMDFARGDMCCWNKCDLVNGLPYLKPTGFVVNKGILAERLSCRCRGGHDHERIQGNNGFGDRSQQAAGYTKEMAMDVIVDNPEAAATAP